MSENQEDDIETTANQELLADLELIKKYTEDMLIELYKTAHANVDASVRCRAAMLQVYRLVKMTRKKVLFYQKDLLLKRRGMNIFERPNKRADNG